MQTYEINTFCERNAPDAKRIIQTREEKLSKYFILIYVQIVNPLVNFLEKYYIWSVIKWKFGGWVLIIRTTTPLIPLIISELHT